MQKQLSLIKTILFSIVMTGSIFPVLAQSTSLTVNITNVRNETGTCYICLFSGESGFAKKENAMLCQNVPIKGGKAHFTFSSLKENTIAVAAFHDENGNSKMDRTFIGKPKEGVGVSNNHMSSFGPPKYLPAVIKLNSGKNNLTDISLKYY